jgi:hypothetical protein
MRTFAIRLGTAVGRAMLVLCRCDGLKDAAVVALLLAVLGAFAARMASGPPGPPRARHEALASAASASVLVG